MKKFKAILGAAVMVAAGLTVASQPVQAAPVAVAGAPVYTPPARLPWGEVPVSQPFKAAPVVSAAQVERNRTALKGMPSRSAAKAKLVGPTYFYASADQTPTVTTDGVFASGTIATPTLNGANHSLGEIAVMKDNTCTTCATVEIGWTVSQAQFGDNAPHLFGYWWKNGVGQGYNGGSGFVPYATPSATLGQSLAAVSGTAKRFGIQHSPAVGSTPAAWWLAYDTGWVGYYPDTLWSSTAYGIPPSNSPAITFTTTAYYRMFGEVAYSGTQALSTACAWMGNGIQGTQPTAPLSVAWGSGALVGPGGTINANMSVVFADMPNYSTWITAAGRTVRYGGRLTASPPC